MRPATPQAFNLLFAFASLIEKGAPLTRICPRCRPVPSHVARRDRGWSGDHVCKSAAFQFGSRVCRAASITSRSSPSSTPTLCHNSVKHRRDHAAPAPTGRNNAVLPDASSPHSFLSTNSHHTPECPCSALPMNKCLRAWEAMTSTTSSVAARPPDRNRRICQDA